MIPELAVFVAVLLTPVAAVWLLPAAAELLAMLTARARRTADPRCSRQRLLVLVPAHDEAVLIRDCVDSLVGAKRELVEADVVVIADNCTDDTARLARDAGARVLERTDSVRRGKPRAIEWAMEAIGIAEYDAVVVVDADTVVAPGFLDAFAAHAPLAEVAVQGYFGLSNESDSWLSLLAGLLARVRYEGQYPLKDRAGLNCPLTGNGMCLGTRLLARQGWAPDALTENWELYARYTARGERIAFAPLARLYAQEAASIRQSGVQRTRWQAGRLMALRTYGMALLRSRIRVIQKLDALAELTAPGPIVQGAIGGGLGIGLLLLPGHIATVVGIAFLVSLVPTAAWAVRAWLSGPDRLVIALALLRVPAYTAWRLVVAVRAVASGRRLGWRRSPRHS